MIKKNIPPSSVGLILHQEIPEYTPEISLGGLQNKYCKISLLFLR